MVTQVVDVSEDARYLSKHRGFMKVSGDEGEIGRVPLDDMTALLLTARQTTISKQLIAELALRQVIIVTCGANFHPLALTLPYGEHFDSAGLLYDQIDASGPFKKRLWKKVVREKISNQRIILERYSANHPAVAELEVLARRVKSGDPDNMEAQAARYYWPALMGKEFRRDKQTGGPNSALNYGYAIIRAAMARALIGAGLTPALGIHHRNRKNAFALVDDMMEPFRPLIDATVAGMDKAELGDDLSVDHKRILAAILDQDVQGEKGLSTVMNAMHALAHGLANSFKTKKDHLSFPEIRRGGKLF